MRMVPLSPAGLPPRRSRSWVLGASLLLHALLLAGLLLVGRKPEAPGSPPSYDLVFEAPDPPSGNPAAAGVPESVPEPAPPPAAPPPSTPAPDILPGPETPSPIVPPAPQAPPAPAPPPVAPPPEPAPQQLAMQDVPPAPPEPVPASPAPPAPEEPPAREVPEVRLEPPAPPPPLAQAVPEFTPPVPPPPLPPLPPRPPPPRSAPPSSPTIGSLSNPLDLNFRAPPVRPPAPRVGAAPGSVASRSIDLSPGPPKPGPNRQEAFFDARAVKLGADWMEGVRAYWLRHRYYPAQAAENGEDGSVDIELVVNRYGRVQSATVKSRSGSTWLDMAAVGTFRGAQLPPVPAEVEAPYAVTLTIHYILLR